MSNLQPYDIRHLILEANIRGLKKRGPLTPNQFIMVLSDDNLWKRYIATFESTMDPRTAAEFRVLAHNTRKHLLEQAVTGNINYYETLTFPILSVFYPRLVARDLVTVSPIKAPEVIKGFLQPKFKKYGSTTYDNAPVYSDASAGVGPTGGFATINVGASVNLLTLIGLDPDTSTIQRGSISITKIFDDVGGAGNSADVAIFPTVDGLFSSNVTIDANTDTIHGSIDFKSGSITLSSTSGVVKSVNVTFVSGQEKNLTSTQVEFTLEKIRLVARDRQITGRWTIQFEQDIRALYDIDLQSQIVAIIGQQIALDIDVEIVNHLFAVANGQPASHKATFSLTPPATFTWGPKEWYKNVTIKLNSLSAAIYTDTNMGVGNCILINPLDAPVFEALDDFIYTYTDSYASGELGFKEASMAGGKFKVYATPVCPQGKALVVFKPDIETQVVYYYCPYIPAVIHPYPLQNVPTMSFLTRYATAVIRPAGTAILQITT